MIFSWWHKFLLKQFQSISLSVLPKGRSFTANSVISTLPSSQPSFSYLHTVHLFKCCLFSDICFYREPSSRLPFHLKHPSASNSFLGSGPDNLFSSSYIHNYIILVFCPVADLSLQTQEPEAAVLLKGTSFTAKLRNPVAVLLGMDRCGSCPLLSAPHCLSSIWTDLKRSENISGVPAWRWGTCIWLTGPSGRHRNSQQGLNISSIYIYIYIYIMPVAVCDGCGIVAFVY